MKKWTKWAASLLLAGCVALTGGGTAEAAQFVDVPAGMWCEKAVTYVCNYGIMDGTSASTFSPQTELNRAMVAQILWAKKGRPIAYYSVTFSDVYGGDWYAPAIEWATQAGIVSGYNDGTFRPNQNITREELATILYNDAGKPHVFGSVNFLDASSISSWAKTPMTWAVKHSIISGVSKDGKRYLEPHGSVTRAQAAVMFMQYVKTGN